MKSQQREGDTVRLKQLCVMQQSCLGRCSSLLAPSVPATLKLVQPEPSRFWAFCTSEGQCFVWAECEGRSKKKHLFFPFLVLDSYMSFGCVTHRAISESWVMRRSHITCMYTWKSHCMFTLCTPSSLPFFLKQLFKSVSNVVGRQLTGLFTKAMLSNFSLSKGLTAAVAWPFFLNSW